LRSTLEAEFGPERIAATVLRPSAVHKLWRKYLSDPTSVGWSRIWSVFVLARWCEIMQVRI
jgi:asparagine synthase (glutamine-hydrolysing)